MTRQSGVDNRQRGYFWGPNELIKYWAPIIGLDGIGLLTTYDVWCDRRQTSSTRGYAFPSRRQEERFYGIPRAKLAVITKILEAVGLLRVEAKQVPTGHGRGNGGALFTSKNFYELVNRDWTLTFDDVIAVLELADRDRRVFRRIRHIFRDNFAPIDQRGNNPWATLLPQLRQHPLWQKLTAREREQASRTRQRFEESEPADPNRWQYPVSIGSDAPDNRWQYPVSIGSDTSENRWQLPVSIGKPMEPMATDSCHKHEEEEEEEEEVDGSSHPLQTAIFQRFASLAGHAAYLPSDRDQDALASLYAEGYSTAEITTAVERAVASALDRGTTPNRFTYCVPAVRDIPPASPGKLAPAKEQAAMPEAATPPVALSSPSAATPNQLDELCQQLDGFIQQRNLDLPAEAVRDLACLATDFDGVAREQHSTGLTWVQEALKLVDSEVNSPVRYIRAILQDWSGNGCDSLASGHTPDDIPQSPPHTPSLPPLPVTASPPPETNPYYERWEQVKRELQLELTRATFDTWVHTTQVIDICQDEEGEATWVVGAANAYARDWLDQRLRSVVHRVVSRLYPDVQQIQFVVAS